MPNGFVSPSCTRSSGSIPASRSGKATGSQLSRDSRTGAQHRPTVRTLAHGISHCSACATTPSDNGRPFMAILASYLTAAVDRFSQYKHSAGWGGARSVYPNMPVLAMVQTAPKRNTPWFLRRLRRQGNWRCRQPRASSFRAGFGLDPRRLFQPARRPPVAAAAGSTSGDAPVLN